MVIDDKRFETEKERIKDFLEEETAPFAKNFIILFALIIGMTIGRNPNLIPQAFNAVAFLVLVYLCYFLYSFKKIIDGD